MILLKFYYIFRLRDESWQFNAHVKVKGGPGPKANDASALRTFCNFVVLCDNWLKTIKTLGFLFMWCEMQWLCAMVDVLFNLKWSLFSCGHSWVILQEAKLINLSIYWIIWVKLSYRKGQKMLRRLNLLKKFDSFRPNIYRQLKWKFELEGCSLGSASQLSSSEPGPCQCWSIQG